MSAMPSTKPYRPKHRRTVPADSTPVGVKCPCTATSTILYVSHYCPRHDPLGYTAYMARHATDSITPVDRDPWSGRQ